MLVACLVAAAACTGAPPPARHAAIRAHGAASTAPSPAVAEDIRAQNALPGDPRWRVTHPAHLYQLEGFTDRTDVLPGASFRLFVSTTARSFRVRAFRMGWYGGDLARLVWISPEVPGRFQPGAKIIQPGSMVVAPWRPSLAVPTTNWPPGSYLLRLDASTGAQSYVPIVIRSPSVAGRAVLVSAVTSYQAYNGWGGYSLYGGPGGSFAARGRRVSFDRPISYSHGAGAYFQLELPLVAVAERLGLPLAYLTSVDLDLYPSILDGARAVVSEAHDEYWSPAMRAAVTRARDRGVNMAFFGANAIFRKIRFESSPLGPDRIEVNYKIPQEDPLYGKDNALVTGNWPIPPDADPESSLVGQSYVCSVTSNFPMVVTDPGSWVWAGAGVHRGEPLPGLVGPEFDQVNPSEPTPSADRGAGPVASQLRCGAHLQQRDLLRSGQRRRGIRFRHRGLDLRSARGSRLPGARPARGAARHPGRHGEYPHRVRRRARGPRASSAGAHPGDRRATTPPGNVLIQQVRCGPREAVTAKSLGIPASVASAGPHRDVGGLHGLVNDTGQVSSHPKSTADNK